MIHSERVKVLNKAGSCRGDYVLYWMQASQRARTNHALEYAVRQANALGKPLVVFFGITDDFPDANLRHYRFMLEGLSQTSLHLQKRGIQMVLQQVSPEKGAVKIARNAALAVTDRGYLDVQRRWRCHVSKRISCPFVQVESDVVVPVETTSEKEEYSAATIRRKILQYRDRFLRPVEETPVIKESLPLVFDSLDPADIDTLLDRLSIDRSVSPSCSFHGGYGEASKHLHTFISKKLSRYHDLRNDPSYDCQSNMSPYLHFGQISPLEIALEVRASASGNTNIDAFLEELIVRRELGINYIYYNPAYASYSALPAWAQKTLTEHRTDTREHRYTRARMEQAATHDPYWNAAQTEMIVSGKMHGYMRMYWGKKIIEWSATPEKAFAAALQLNNKYFLDGRDPGGYTGVAWCFGKHDRAWSERPVFGKIRYMNDKGLRRKFNIDGYVKKIEQLSRHHARDSQSDKKSPPG